jgi:hypothetical protein
MGSQIITYEKGIGYVLGGYSNSSTGKMGGVFHADTEADARAKMLVYLLENMLLESPASVSQN